VFDGAFQNSGQVCLAIKRAYVHESVYDQVCEELVALAKEAIVDDGLKQGTKLGPLQNKMQYEKVKGFLDDARTHGKIIAGGEPMDRPGYFIQPTIVRDIKEGSRLVDEEQFGPVLPRMRTQSMCVGMGSYEGRVANASHVPKPTFVKMR
jgi:acyl-CoA reductase-like NAD-dependent aldehyde dehydrogenase